MPTVSASFSVDRTTVDDADPRTTLSFVVSAPLPSGTKIRIWDGRRVTNIYGCISTAAGCVATQVRGIAEDAETTFHAFLTTSGGWDSTTNTPTRDFVDLGAITVRNVGYLGHITSFTSERQGTNYYGTPKFRLSMALSLPVVDYKATIVDVTSGKLLATCSSGTPSSGCSDYEYFSSGIRVYEATVSSGGYAGGGEYRGRVASQTHVIAHAGDLSELEDDLARYAFVAFTAPPASMSLRALAASAQATNTSLAMAADDIAMCGRVAQHLRANTKTRLSTGDFWNFCIELGLGRALAYLATVVSIGTIIDIIIEAAVDPDAPFDGTVDAERDCALAAVGVSNWCTETQDDVGLNPGRPTTADYEGAVNSPKAYAEPDTPWEPQPLKPRFRCLDGTLQWTCAGLGGAEAIEGVYMLVDGEWVAVSGAPVNCMFLDESGDLRLNADGAVDTTVRDEFLDRLLHKQDLEDTYERHHIVTKYSNTGDEEKKRLVEQMHAVYADYGLGVDDPHNLVVIPHRGPHPLEYHRWIRDALVRVDRAAAGDREAFLTLFEQQVTAEILRDPSIVLAEYWTCRR